MLSQGGSIGRHLVNLLRSLRGAYIAFIRLYFEKVCVKRSEKCSSGGGRRHDLKNGKEASEF